MENEKIKNIQIRQAQPMNTDLQDEYVAMANDMVKGTSNLTLTEAKLLRLLIMQCKPDDKEFNTFSITITELAKVLNLDKSGIYREIDKITTHLLKEIIYIGDGKPDHKWLKFPWLSYCEYDKGILKISLNEILKPFILGLQKWYTQYKIEEVINYTSIHAIKLYELIALYLRNQKPCGDSKIKIYIDLETIKRATNTEDKYESISRFKSKVIEAALKDINEFSSYHIDYEIYKQSRQIAGFYFIIQSQARYLYIGQKEIEENQIKNKKGKQITLNEYSKEKEEND